MGQKRVKLNTQDNGVSITHGFGAIIRKDFDKWLDYQYVKEGKYLERAKERILEEIYVTEIDKQLLEDTAFYRAILDAGQDFIKSGKIPLDTLDRDTEFSRAYRWAEIRYYRCLDMIRKELPKNVNVTGNFTDIIKSLPV